MMSKTVQVLSVFIALSVSACTDENTFVIPGNDPCTNGDEKCINSSYRICKDNIWTVEEICKNGCDGNQCAKSTPSCTDNLTTCNDNILKQCKSGKWIITECENGCDGNICKEEATPVCTDGQTSCVIDVLKTCQNGKWTLTDCPSGCDGDICNETPDVPPCTDGTATCNNSILRTCQNGIWKLTECTNGCDGNICKVPDCNNGEVECQDNILKKCQNGNWNESLCPYGCDITGNACSEPKDCNTGETICNNNILKSCQNNMWDSGTTCPIGCHVSGAKCAECKDNDIKCSDNKKMTCSGGEWTSKTCDNGCNSNGMDCAECQNGTTTCSNNTLKTCTNGEWNSLKCENGCNSSNTACETVNNNQPTRYIMTNRLLSPITPYVLQSMKDIAANNSSRSTNAFMKVGDSHYDYDFDGCFMKCFSDANSNAVTLDSHTNLQNAITEFQKSKDSFMRDSLSAIGGKSTRDMFNACGSPDCITQEINNMNPRFAFFGHGTNDMGNGCYSHAAITGQCNGYGYSLQDYYRQLSRSMDIMISNGVIPLVSAIAPRNDTPEKVSYMSGAPNIASTSDYPMHMVSTFNAVARGNAEARQIPFFDTYQAFYPLDSHGIRSDKVHGSTSGSPCNFSATGLKYGVNTRNLYSMEMLNNAWNAYTSGNAPDKVIEPFKGSGTPTDPYIITSLPFTHSANTKTTGKNIISTYSCDSSVNEYGPEIYYKLELKAKTRIRTFVVSERRTYSSPYDDADLDIQILRGAADGSKCIKRSDIMIHGSLAAGTYYFSIDTFGTASSESANRGKYLFGIVECDADDKYCDMAL